MVTQCPIAPNGTYTYVYTVPDQAGAFHARFDSWQFLTSIRTRQVHTGIIVTCPPSTATVYEARLWYTILPTPTRTFMTWMMVRVPLTHK